MTRMLLYKTNTIQSQLSILKKLIKDSMGTFYQKIKLAIFFNSLSNFLI